MSECFPKYVCISDLKLSRSTKNQQKLQSYNLNLRTFFFHNNFGHPQVFFIRQHSFFKFHYDQIKLRVHSVT